MPEEVALPEDSNEQRPDEGTLALIYDEVAAALQGQHDSVESLTGRAQQLFGFATVILAILAGVVPTHPHHGTRIAYACALPVFALAAFYSGRAWEFRKWRSDPKATSLWDDFRGKSEEHLRHQVILNRLKAIAANDEDLNAKLRLVKLARIFLYVGFLYIAALLLYQVASG